MTPTKNKQHIGNSVAKGAGLISAEKSLVRHANLQQAAFPNQPPSVDKEVAGTRCSCEDGEK